MYAMLGGTKRIEKNASTAEIQRTASFYIKLIHNCAFSFAIGNLVWIIDSHKLRGKWNFENVGAFKSCVKTERIVLSIGVMSENRKATFQHQCDPEM